MTDSDYKMQSDINRELIEAIKEHNISDVRRCLQAGANPNCTWTHDEDSKLDRSSLQPTTPLSLLVFLISNSLLSNDDLSEYYEIASLLLENDAGPEPATLLARQRYGIYRESEDQSMFDRIYHLVSRAYHS